MYFLLLLLFFKLWHSQSQQYMFIEILGYAIVFLVVVFIKGKHLDYIKIFMK